VEFVEIVSCRCRLLLLLKKTQYTLDSLFHDDKTSDGKKSDSFSLSFAAFGFICDHTLKRSVSSAMISSEECAVNDDDELTKKQKKSHFASNATV
jgi:hypothetical protein